jgi:hypothetical protein
MNQELPLNLQNQPAAIRPANVPNKKEPSNNHKVIHRFVTVEFSKNQAGFWPKEMKWASQLIREYGMEFLMWLQPPNGYKVSSLIWFLTPEGKHYLSDQMLERAKQTTESPTKNQQVQLSPNKIGEDVVVLGRPKSVKEFLKYGQKT